jgi:hypothetical protein
MAKLLDIVEGWTAELGPFTLKNDGGALNLTGLTVVPLIRDADQRLITFAGTSEKDADQTTGRMYLTPTAADFKAARAPYTLRWKVTDSDGKVVHYPNGEADTIEVRL